MCGANIGLSSGFHANKASECAKECTNEESDSDGPVRTFAAAAHKAEQQCNDDGEISEYFPFSSQKCHGAFGDVSADLFHTISACILFGNPTKPEKSVQQTQHSHD